MEIKYNKELQYLNAQKKVKEIKGFYSHLTVMFFLLPFLVFINLKLYSRLSMVLVGYIWKLMGIIFSLAKSARFIIYRFWKSLGAKERLNNT